MSIKAAINLLQLNRIDLAKQIHSDDELVEQLLESLCNITQLDSVHQAYFCYSELCESNKSSLLLNNQACCQLVRGLYEEAFDLLSESVRLDSCHPNTLANLIVCSLRFSRDPAPYFAALSQHAPNHPLLQASAEKSALFDDLIAQCS